MTCVTFAAGRPQPITGNVRIVASINLGELLSLSLAYREARGYFVQALSIARDIDTPAGESQALRESDEATSKKETQAKAPKTYNRPSRSTAASAPQRPSVRAPSSSS